MRIGRIGTNPYVQQARTLGNALNGAAEKSKQQEAEKQKLPGWQGRDTYESTIFSNKDGKVTAKSAASSGNAGFDYLMQTAANAARFDNFNL